MQRYMTDADFQAMAKAGVKRVRLPLAWAAFASDASSSSDDSSSSDAPDASADASDAEKETIVTDPVYSDLKLVTVSRLRLASVIRRCKPAGLTVLLDIHAFPGWGCVQLGIQFTPIPSLQAPGFNPNHKP
jgi:aryl-phospho-beta-D-glucosidase BglC (GH1 family)